VPLLGEHAEAVLTSLAGYTAERVRQLRDKGVFGEKVRNWPERQERLACFKPPLLRGTSAWLSLDGMENVPHPERSPSEQQSKDPLDRRRCLHIL